MAMGILAVFDMAGIDVGVNVHRTNAHRYPPDPTYYQADAALHAAGRLGQKTGKGFYRYEKGDRTRHDDPEAVEILARRAAELGVAPRAAHRPGNSRALPFSAAQRRACEFSKKASRSAPATSTWCGAWVMAFRAIAAGPMFHADTIGLPALLAGMEKYRGHVRAHALGAGTFAGAAGARRTYACRLG